MLGINAKNRWQAFGIHLLISLALFIIMCTVIVVLWYPGLLFTTEGGWQGVRLIASIDFVIGPILTLLVYKPGKWGLKFDLACIGILQAICLTYGMYVVNYSRPAVVAYADGVYYTTPLLRFESRGIDIRDHELLHKRLPVWVNIKLPDDPKQRLQVKMDRIFKGLETSVDLYEPYAQAVKVLIREGYSLSEARTAGIEIPDSLNSNEIRIYKLNTRYDNYAVAVNTRTGEFEYLAGVFEKSTEATLRKIHTRTPELVSP